MKKTCGGEGFEASNETEFIQAIKAAQQIDKPVIINSLIEERALLPGKVEWDQAIGHSKYLFKKTIEKKRDKDTPPLKTILKRLWFNIKTSRKNKVIM